MSLDKSREKGQILKVGDFRSSHGGFDVSRRCSHSFHHPRIISHAPYFHSNKENQYITMSEEHETRSARPTFQPPSQGDINLRKGFSFVLILLLLSVGSQVRGVKG